MTAAVGVPPTPVSPPPAGAVPREAAETEGSFPDVRNAQVQQKITHHTESQEDLKADAKWRSADACAVVTRTLRPPGRAREAAP